MLLVAVFAVVTAASLTLLAPIARKAEMIAHEAWPTLAQCAAIANDGERLACFDQLGKQRSTPPPSGPMQRFARIDPE